MGPAADRTGRITASDGVEIAWHAWGDNASGSPVLLQHGFSADTEVNWRAPGLVSALTAAGRSVVGIDARGHGASAKPYDPALYGEARMARDVSELMDALGLGEADLAGYSMGAVVSLIVGVEERRIRRLVIGGVGEGVLLHGGVDRRAIASDALAEALETDDEAGLPPALAAVRANVLAMGGDRRALAAQARRMHADPIALDRITAKTLVIAGHADPFAMAPERLAAAIPGARLAIVPGDHLAAVAAPAFAEALVEFLRP